VTTKLLDPIEVVRAVEEQRAHLRRLGLPEQWAEVGEVFADQYIRITRDPVRFPSGRTGTYLRIDRPSNSSRGTIAVARCGNRQVFVNHYRYATGRVHLEYPRGFGEAGETPEQTVARELREETGIEALSMARLGMIYADTGLLNIPIEVYAVQGAASGPVAGAELDPDEGMGETIYLTSEEVRTRIAAGGITDALTLAAYAMNEAADS